MPTGLLPPWRHDCIQGQLRVSKLSCRYRALICGDSNPEGPASRSRLLSRALLADTRDVNKLFIRAPISLCKIQSATQAAKFRPSGVSSGPRRRRRGDRDHHKWAADNGAGFALIIDEHGRTTLQLGDGTGSIDLTSVEQVCSLDVVPSFASFDLRKPTGLCNPGPS